MRVLMNEDQITRYIETHESRKPFSSIKEEPTSILRKFKKTGKHSCYNRVRNRED